MNKKLRKPKQSLNLNNNSWPETKKQNFSIVWISIIPRRLAETKVEANQLIELTQKALDADKDLLSDSELTSIKNDLKDLINVLNSSNNDKIKEATKQLNTKSEPFAAKRMDRSIQKALTGKSINKLEF